MSRDTLFIFYLMNMAISRPWQLAWRFYQQRIKLAWEVGNLSQNHQSQKHEVPSTNMRLIPSRGYPRKPLSGLPDLELPCSFRSNSGRIASMSLLFPIQSRASITNARTINHWLFEGSPTFGSWNATTSDEQCSSVDVSVCTTYLFLGGGGWHKKARFVGILCLSFL